MPDDALAVARRAVDAWKRRDLDAWSACQHDDVEWDVPHGLPFGGMLRGRDAVRQFAADLWMFFADYRMDVERWSASGEMVVLEGVHRGTASTGGVHEVPFREVMTVRDGRIVRFAEQHDAALVMRALADELSADKN